MVRATVRTLISPATTPGSFIPAASHKVPRQLFGDGREHFREHAAMNDQDACVLKVQDLVVFQAKAEHGDGVSAQPPAQFLDDR
jgi:hypothetical protein